MNSIADMGGMHGFGPINPEDDEPTFHDDWERKVCTINMAIWFGGAWSADETRYSMESMAPAEYLASSYYEHWLHFMEDLLVKKGVVTQEELEAGQLTTSGVGSSLIRQVQPDECWSAFQASGSTAMPSEIPARFSVGDRVRALNINPPTHTRSPRYVRGKVGTVVTAHGGFAFPDTRVIGKGDHPQPLYTVRFDGANCGANRTRNEMRSMLTSSIHT